MKLECWVTSVSQLVAVFWCITRQRVSFSWDFSDSPLRTSGGKNTVTPLFNLLSCISYCPLSSSLSLSHSLSLSLLGKKKPLPGTDTVYTLIPNIDCPGPRACFLREMAYGFLALCIAHCRLVRRNKKPRPLYFCRRN